MNKHFNDKVSPKDVCRGDIIEFYNWDTRKEGPYESPILGLVIQVDKKTDKEIAGYHVFPVLEHPKSKTINPSPNHLLITFPGDIKFMGLNQNKNYQVLYAELVVKNDPDYVGKDGTRGVTRLGNMEGTRPLGIIEGFLRQNNRTSIGKDVSGIKNSSNAFEAVETYKLCEKGENIHLAKARQDKANSQILSQPGMLLES